MPDSRFSRVGVKKDGGVGVGNKYLPTSDANSHLLQEILIELKIINKHLQLQNEVEILSNEIES